MAKDIRALADPKNPQSFSNRMRSRRFRVFEDLVADLPKPLRMLDVGGTQEFWENRGWAGREDVSLVLLNQTAPPSRHANIETVAGDAADLSRFADGSFDVCFSNSVIEHLFTRERQTLMAKEVQRVAKAYWVQTPNFWFPMEPHYHVAGWHWMPEWTRVALLRRFRFGWCGPIPDRAGALKQVQEMRLMSAREMRQDFPGGTLLREHFAGMTKSFVMAHGFPGLAKGVSL